VVLSFAARFAHIRHPRVVGCRALRWCAAGMVEAGKQFRRVNGHLHLPTLRAALEREFAEPVGPVVHNDEVSAA
jgi:putative transposase